MPIVEQPDSKVRATNPPAGDRAAHGLADLVHQHQRMVWRYLRLLGADPHEADDLMQDTFVRVAEGCRRGELLQSPAAFLRGVARNLLLTARRRTRTSSPAGEWADAVDRLIEQQPGALDDDRIEALRTCITRLQGRMRQAVEWHHKEGVSCEEAAARLGLGLDGIKSLLRRARKALRECIEQRTSGARS
jgi:RNA polymerase sigma-70 factor (ECF subfamily)